MACEICNLSRGLSPGTAGAVLRDRQGTGTCFVLTAGHVLGIWAGVGDQVEMRLPSGALLLGELLRWNRIGENAPETEVDAALVRVSAATAEALQAVPGLRTRGVAEAVLGEAVTLHTAQGPLTGRMTCRADVGMRAQGSSLLRWRLKGALCWTPDAGATQPGDSGAPLLNARGQLIGLHAGRGPAEMPGTATATPAKALLDWADAALLVDGEDPAAKELPRVQPGSDGSDDASDVLARTMWGEARGEGEIGQLAVAHVVFNRVDAARWWGRDVVAVCRKPWQFSCWNPGPRGRDRLAAVTARDSVFSRSLQLASELLRLQHDAHDERVRRDPTGGATHFHTVELPTPRWARGHRPCQRIGRHLFFRGIA